MPTYVSPLFYSYKWAEDKLFCIKLYMRYLLLFIKGVVLDIVNLNFVYEPELVELNKEDLFYRYIYCQIKDNFSRPLQSEPGTTIRVQKRRLVRHNATFDFLVDSDFVDCTNLGSYNYLGMAGFSETRSPSVQRVIENYGSFDIAEEEDAGGEETLQRSLEAEMCKFLEKEACMLFGMGFAGNASLIPCLVNNAGIHDPDILVFSDEFNHSSLVEGIRLSNVTVRTFAHNDMESLASLLQKAVHEKLWKEIFVFVEGLYSMEGTFCKLADLVSIKKKFNFRIYLDEAHSIGAVGESGRGITEQFGVDRSEIDFMYGTFTKSFGSSGGYFCSDAKVVRFLKKNSTLSTFSNSYSSPACKQCLMCIRELAEGSEKPSILREKSNFFRENLKIIGFDVLGDEDSPIIPVLIQDLIKLVRFSRVCLKEGLAVVIVGNPAVPLLQSRARFCISSKHSDQQLLFSLDKLNKIFIDLGLKSANRDIIFRGVASSRTTHSSKRGDKSTYTPLSDTTLQHLRKISLSVYDTDTTFLVKRGCKFHSVDLSNPSVLNLCKDPRVRERCSETVKRYGVGSCGPRGFYGTNELHLLVEKKIASIINMERAIIYSMSIVTASSVIPSACKKDSILLYDDGLNDSILNGVFLSRCDKVKVDHNSVKSLEDALFFCKSEKNEGKKVFYLCEGVYFNDASLCPLDEVVELQKEYIFEIIMDDSCGFGVLGETGLGTPQHFGIFHRELFLYIFSAETTFGGVGGFCAGSEASVIKQELNGTGYCFSASPPSYICSGILTAIDIYHNIATPLQFLKRKIECVSELVAAMEFNDLSILRSDASPFFAIHSKKTDPLEKEAHIADVQKRISEKLGYFVKASRSQNGWFIRVFVNLETEIEVYEKFFISLSEA